MRRKHVHDVSYIIERRYGIGDTLLELFLDHEAIHWLEEMISYGADQCGGEETDTWLEYLETQGDTDLEAARFGSYAAFLSTCDKAGIDGRLAFQAFANASGYFGTDMQLHEILTRVSESAASYVDDGKVMLADIHTRSAAL